MATSTRAAKAQFAHFELDLSSGELIRDGHRSRLQGQPFRVLCVLLEHSGELVTREELQQQLWPGETFVDFEHGLNKAIAKLREALEDAKASSRLIETIPRRGYRLNAEVRWVHPNGIQPIAETAAQPHQPSRAKYWIAAGLALALATALWVSRRTLFGWLDVRPTIHSVAVLPLVNLSNDPEQEYLADGITEQLITDLSYAKPLRVLSRASTIRFKNSNLSVAEIANQLDVDALIEGTVLRSNNTIRVTVRLTAAKPERQLWAASYEREAVDMIGLQNRLAADAVNQMRSQLTPAGQTQLSLEQRINPQAYDEYLQARFLFHGERRHQSIPHLERAIQLDPNFALAYAALGEEWGFEGVPAVNSNSNGTRGVHEFASKALEYSEKAVSLDQTSSEAYASLGHSLMQNRRWNEAEQALRHAIELDPNSPDAANYLVILLIQKGRVQEGLDLSRELKLNNPVTTEFRRVYAIALFNARKYDEAIAECEHLIELDPNFRATYGSYAQALAQKGRFQEADTALNKSLLGKDPGVHAWLYALQGNATVARQLLKEGPSPPINAHAAVAHYLLGERDLGLAELDYLANDRWNEKTYFMRVDPLFDPMRNDPRFTAIVKKTGLLDN